MNGNKQWWRSKTIWLNVLVLTLGILGVVAGSEVMHPEIVVYITSLAIPILNVILRFLTNQPIGRDP